MYKHIINTIKELETANKNPEFRAFRLEGFKPKGLVITFVAIFMIMIFIKLDFSTYTNLDYHILIHRLINTFLLVINAFIFYKYQKYLVPGMFFGFYVSAVFIAYLSALRSGFLDSYKVDINFLLMIWFAFVPFSYKTLTINGILFYGIYVIFAYMFGEQSIQPNEVLELTYFLFGTIILGTGFGFLYNKNAYDLYKKTKDISQAAEDLKESEEKYRNLVERANDGVVILQDGYVRFINTMIAKILGYEVSEMLDTPFVNYLAPEVRESVLDKYIKRQVGIEQNSIYEAVLISKTYQRKDVEFNAGLITYKGRIATLTYIRDITERKKAELALKESEKRFSTFMDLIPAAVFIKGSNRRYIYANKFLKDLTGLDNICGKTLEEVSSGELLDVLKKFEDETYSSLSNEITDEFTYNHNDKFYIFQSKRFRIEQADGNTLICGIDWNITEQKNAMEELRMLNERLTFHIRQTPLAYIEWDSEFNVIDWNPAAERIFGYTKNEAIGRHAYSIIVPKQEHIQINTIWLNIIKRSGGTRSTNRNITKDNREIICEWYNTPLKDSNGNIIGVASLVEDISERIKLEKDLEKAVSILEKNYSDTKEQMQTYFSELQNQKNEFLKLQKENLQSQFEMLKNQVNPHFLFNSLNVLSSLITVEPELAERFTEHLSKIYRYVLENKEKDLVPLSTELDFLYSYVFLLEIRFKDKMQVTLSIPPEFLDRKILPLSLQILIENAIKHNIFSKRHPLNINIFIDEEQYLNVINNYNKRENFIHSTGLGLENIRNRYKFFTNKELFFGQFQDNYNAKIPLL